MANSRTIEFKGHFDGKQVLDELKKIRQNMADAGADDNLFKGIDKDIAATEKLVTEMMAQIQKGFSNTKEVNAFEKQIDKLQTNFLKISSGMQNINIAENFGLNSPEINKLTKEIEQLTAAQDHLKEVSKNALDQAQKSIGLRNDEVAEIKKAIDANEDLEEALKKVGKAKEKATLANVGSNAAKTDAGKEYLSKASIGLSLDDLGAKASSGNTAKAKNDARKRYDNGELYGNAGNRELDETKANAAINEVYQKTLEKMITTGGNAAEAIEEMKKALADYGIEIENVDKLQENFYSDIEGFYKSPAVSGGAKSAVTKARKIGQTDAQGNYQLSANSMTNLVNNEEITASTRAEQELTQKIREREEAERKAQEEGAQAASKHSESLQDVNKNIEDSSQALKEGSDATRDATENQNKLNDSFDNMKGAIKTFLSIGSAISALRNVVRNTFNDIKELDKSFANIAMVTDYSVGQMWESYDQYAEMANELGQSTKSVIEASGLFYQQGLDTADSLALTEDTMKLATLAGLDFAEATSQMTAALRGFHMEMNEGGRVTDVYSELAAKAAADVEGIAYAMSKTASIASSAGMEFETTSAFLTQMIETTQEAPENIGTAMKTIIARFTELKENVAGTADSEFDDLDYNKVDTALKSVGISLKDAAGQFRNLDDVFLELSEKWNTLDRNSQRYIATIAAGSRQQSRFIAMMENYDRTMELVDTAYDSAGKSSEQFAKYQDTVEYKMNQLQNTWEQFRTQFFNSTFFKTIIDGLSSVLEKISDFSTIDIISLASVWIIFGKTIIQNIITGIQNSTQGLMTVFSNIFEKIKAPVFSKISLSVDISKAEKNVKTLEQKIKVADKNIEKNKIILDADTTLAMKKLKDYEQEYNRVYNKAISNNFSEDYAKKLATNSATSKTGMTADEMSRAQLGRQAQSRINVAQQSKDKNTELLNAAIGKQETLKVQAQARGQMIGQILATSITMAITAVATADNPIQAFGQVMLTGLASLIPSLVTMATTAGGSMSAAFIASTAGIGALILGITAAIAGIAVAIKNSFDEAEANKFENRFKEAKKAAEEAEKAAEEASSAAKEAQETFKKTTDLKERFTELNEKQVLTNEEQEEYNSLVAQIQDEFPNLISYYNEVTGELRVQNDLWDSILEKQRLEAEAAAKQEFIASNSAVLARTNYDQYDLASTYSEKTGVESATLIEAFQTEGYDYKQLANEITSSLEYKSWEYADQRIDEDALAQLYGLDLSNYTDDQYQQAIDDLSNAVLAEPEKLEEALKGASDTNQDLLNKQYEMIAANFGEVLTTMDAEIGEGEKRLKELIAVQSTKENGLKEITASTYSKNNDGSKSFFNALGGAKAVASDNSFSDWEDLDEGNKISGLSEYGIENVEDAKNMFLKAYESEADAAEAWSKWQGDAAGQMKIFDTIIQEAILVHMEEAAAATELTDAEYTQLETLYSEAMEGGVTQEEIDNLSSFLIDKGIDESTRTQFLEDIQNAYKEALESIESVGLSENTVADWSSDQMSQYANYISSLGETTGETYAQNFGKQVLNSFKSLDLSPDEIMTAFSAVDWSTVTLDNLDETKDTFIATMKTAMGDAFDEEKVNTMWKNFFAAADNYNVIDFSISTSGGLQELKNSMNENLDNIVDGFSGLSDIIEEQLTNGFISYSSSREVEDALTEMGLEASKYLNYNPNGDIDFKAEELKNDLLSSEDMMVENLLQKAREETEEKLKEIQARKAILKASMGELENAKRIVQVNQINLKTLDQQAQIMAAMDQIDYTSNLDSLNALFSGIDKIDNTVAQEAFDELEEEEQAVKDFLENELVEGSDTWNEMVSKAAAASIDMQTTWAEAANAAVEASDDMKDAIEELNKAEKALNEAKYGTDTYKNALDDLYNYETLIEKINKDLDETSDKLQNLSVDDDAGEIFKQFGQLANQDALYRESENKVIEQSIKNYEKVLQDNFSGYFDVVDGIYTFNSALLDAPMNDQLKDYALETIETLNELNVQYDENLNAIEERRKEYEDFQKESLDNYVNLQDQVVDMLKEAYQKEIDATEEKYSALEEADNNYIDALEDAINKQRELRDKANQYEDLATKEKKLSLMQRDTSGANQKAILETEKEIEESREDLLDSEVDRIIESMKELYEEQQATREAEIEYRQAVLDNANLVEEANQIISSWESFEDMFEWFLNNNSELEGASVEKIEQYQIELEDLYNAKNIYATTSKTDFDDFLTYTEDEIDLTVESISETLTSEADRSFTEITNTVNEEIAAAEKAFSDAQKNIANTEKEIMESIQRIAQAAADAANDKINNNNDKEDKTTDDNNKNNINSGLTGTARNEAEKVMRSDLQNNYSNLKGLSGIALDNAEKTAKRDFINKYSENKDLAEEVWNSVMKKPEGPTSIDQLYDSKTIKNNMLSFMKSGDTIYTIIKYEKGYGYYQEQDMGSPVLETSEDSIKNYIKQSYDKQKIWGYMKSTKQGKDNSAILKNSFIQYKGYATGGLVNYTGPAWVDGTPAKPEAFLNAQDTQRIGEAAKILAQIPALNGASENVSTNIGDTTIEIHINVENIDSDYDVDQMIERVKNDIIDVSKPVGTSVILKK